jgi:arabinoxylan arabinofuranohydrolase
VTDGSVLKVADVDQSGKVEINDLVLLQQFVLGAIDTFPNNRPPVDTAAMESIFKNLSINSSWKNDGENNVLWTHRFGADPGFMVYKDRLYVYTTNDAP